MNRTVLLAAGVFCLFFNFQLFGHPSQGEKLGPGYGQRYLVLATMRTSTMQKELRQAAAAGCPRTRSRAVRTIRRLSTCTPMFSTTRPTSPTRWGCNLPR